MAYKKKVVYSELTNIIYLAEVDEKGKHQQRYAAEDVHEYGGDEILNLC